MNEKAGVDTSAFLFLCRFMCHYHQQGDDQHKAVFTTASAMFTHKPAEGKMNKDNSHEQYDNKTRRDPPGPNPAYQ